MEPWGRTVAEAGQLMKLLIFAVLGSVLMVTPVHLIFHFSAWQAFLSYSLSGQAVMGAALIGSIVLKSKA